MNLTPESCEGFLDAGLKAAANAILETQPCRDTSPT
jgi:hypothetical protein